MFYKGLIFGFIIIIIGNIYCYDVKEETKNSTQFTLDFYKNMFDQNMNTIVSPFSFRVLLSILYQSVSDRSELEIRNKVYFGEKQESLISQRHSINRFINSSNMKIVNKIFLKKGVSLKQDFLTIVNDLKGNIEQVDFSHSEATANIMNNWVEEQTNNLIKDLVSSSSVTPETALFLINTLYFKGLWAKPFDTTAIYKSPFTAIDGSLHRIDMLFDQDTRKLAVLPSIKARVLELEYTTGSNFVFWMLMPDEDSNIINLKNSLTHNIIKEISENFRESIYDIVVPIFEVESSIDGVKLLKELGVNSIFNNYECFMLNNNEGLKVKDIKQKSKIIFNAQGTEITSASYSKATFRTYFDGFEVNRPFIYLVLTADTLEPVFIGHFSKP